MPLYLSAGYRQMLFFLRLAFWIMVICLLLPGSSEENRRLMSSAERAMSDVRGFCQRNPDVCADARAAAVGMLSRLRSGAQLLQTWIAAEEPKREDRLVPPDPDDPHAEAPSAGEPAAAAPVRLQPRWQDSLSDGDKRMPWRGPLKL